MKKDQYVLEGSDGFYTGESYIYQGSKYAVVDRNISRAKIYSSEARALRACKTAFENYDFITRKLEDISK